MIEQKDDYCKLITTDEPAKRASYNAIEWIGTVAATRLINEPILEIRKFESGVPGMAHCAVVMCSRRVLWSLPRKHLERVEKK